MSPRRGLDVSTILDAAAELADAHGIEGVTLARLAARLGVRSPSLYNHVDGLPDVRKRLAVHGIERLRDALLKATAGRSGDEAVHALSKAYLNLARNHPGLYESSVLAPDPQDTDIQKATTEVLRIVVQVFQEFGLEDDKALHAVRSLRSLLHGFASLERRGGFALPLDLDQSLAFAVDTFLAGIRTKARPGL